MPFSSYTSIYAYIDALKVKAKRQRRSYLTDLINSVVEIIIILFQALHRLSPSLGATYWESMHLIYDQFYAYMCMSAPPFFFFFFLVRFARSYFNECSMVMYCQKKRRRQERKKNVTNTGIISTSINQVDSPFSLSFYGSILSIFLNMQAQEVTSSQKSLTRYRHMLTYS